MASLWELFVKVSGDTSNYKQSIKESVSITEQFGATFDTLDAKLSKAVGFLTAGTTFVAAGGFALSAALKFEAAGNTIERMTGATGAQLKGLEESMKTVFAGTTQSADVVAEALSKIEVKTGATGTSLNDLTAASLRFAKATGGDVSATIEANQKLFAQWGISTDMQVASMDKLYVVVTKTGIPVDRLTSTITAVSPALRSLGFNFDEVAALTGNFAKHGLDLNDVMGSLSKGMVSLAAKSTDPKQAFLDLVEKMQNASTAAGAVNIATSDFGKRGAVVMADAARQGAFAFQGLQDDMEKSSGTIKKVADDTATFAGKWTKFMHGLQVDIAPVGESVIAWADTVMGRWDTVSQFTGTFLEKIEKSIKEHSLAAQFLGLLSGGSGSNSITATDGLSAYLKAFTMILQGPAKVATPAPAHRALGPVAPPGLEDILTPEQVAKQIAANFSTVGMEDYKNKLSEITKAFGDLVAAGKLTVTQEDAVKEKIQQLKDAIADFQKPFMALANAKPFDAEAWSQSLESPLQLADDKMVHLISSVTGVDEGLVRISLEADKTRKAFDGFPRQFFGTAAYDELPEASKRLDEIGGYVLKVDTKHLQEVTDQLRNMGLLSSKVSPEIDKIQKSLKDLGLDTAKNDTAKLRDDLDGLNLAVKGNIISQETYGAGIIKIVDDMNKLGVAVDAQTQKAYDLAKAHIEAMNRVKGYAEEAKKDMANAFESIERGLAMDIIQWKGWGATLKTGVQTLGADMLGIMLKAFFQPVEKELVKLAGKIVSTITGALSNGASNAAAGAGQAAGAAAGVGSGAAGAAGSLAGAGITGVVGAVAGVVGAVSSVIGNFQMAGMNKSLDVIVNHTLRTANDLANLRADEWSRHASLFQKLDDIWKTIQDKSDIIAQRITDGGGTGGGGGKSLVTFNNCAFNGGMTQSAANALMTQALGAAGVAGAI
jgi:hypothetical protein